MADNELTSEGTRLVKDWLGTQARLDRAKSEVISAQCDLSNSARALAKWMLPEDANGASYIKLARTVRTAR